MTTLGDVLGSASRSAAGFQTWMEAADPGLAAEVKRAVASSGGSPAAFARAAVADFSRFADDEDWARLTRIVRDHADPGAACLAAMYAGGWPPRIARAILSEGEEREMSATPRSRAPHAADGAPLNPALKQEHDATYGPDQSGTDPMDSVSVKKDEGTAWPTIWAVTTIVCVIVAVVLIVL